MHNALASKLSNKTYTNTSTTIEWLDIFRYTALQEHTTRENKPIAWGFHLLRGQISQSFKRKGGAQSELHS